MITKSEFKETDIGLMPDDWKANKLKEIAFTTSGGTPSRQKKEFYTGDISWVKSGELNDNYIWDTEEKITKEAIDNSSAKLLNPETLLIAMYGATVGKTAILKIKATTNQAVCSVVPNEKINTDYLRYYFVHIRQHLLNSRYGGAQPNISQTILKDTIVLYPSRNEQDRIAYILLKLQQTIAQQEKIIEKTKELKRSLMHRLFTYGLRGEELKETEIGLVPESWEIVEVGELGEIITGTTPPTKNKEYYTGGSYQFISPFDLGNTKYAYKTEKEISSKGLSVSRCLPKDAVLVVCIGSTIGKVGMTSKDKSATNQQINTIVCDKKYNPHFVYYCLLFKSEYIRSLATPSPVPIMSKGKFQKAVISIPANRDEQDKIVEILSAIDEKVEKAQSRKRALQALFRSMLNLLMTGQVRVKDIDFGEDCE